MDLPMVLSDGSKRAAAQKWLVDELFVLASGPQVNSELGTFPPRKTSETRAGVGLFMLPPREILLQRFAAGCPTIRRLFACSHVAEFSRPLAIQYSAHWLLVSARGNLRPRSRRVMELPRGSSVWRRTPTSSRSTF